MTSSVTIDKADQAESSLEYYKKRLAEVAGKIELTNVTSRYAITSEDMYLECEYLAAHGVRQEEINCIADRAQRVVRVTYLTESLQKGAAAYRMAIKESHHEMEIVQGWHVVCLQSDLAALGLGRHEIGAMTLGVTV